MVVVVVVVHGVTVFLRFEGKRKQNSLMENDEFACNSLYNTSIIKMLKFINNKTIFLKRFY